MLDAVIVFTSVPSVLFPSLSDLQGVRVLRALRALRPLVLIKRLKGLRQVDSCQTDGSGVGAKVVQMLARPCNPATPRCAASRRSLIQSFPEADAELSNTASTLAWEPCRGVACKSELESAGIPYR